MEVVYNVRGILECALGVLVGLAIHAITGSGIWAGAGGCLAAATADIAWRIKDGTNDDMMQADRGGMLYHVPVWLIGVSVGIVVLIVGYVFPLLDGDSDDRSGVRYVGGTDSELEATDSELEATDSELEATDSELELEPGPLGELVVVEHPTSPTVEIARWWRPIDILGNDRVTVELVDAETPPAVSAADAFAICASDPNTTTYDASTVRAYQDDKLVFVVSRPDCDQLEPRTALACTATRCSRLE